MDNDSVTIVAALSDLSQEPAARELADAVEFRMDLAEGNPVARLEAYDGELPVVATNRVVAEGGRAAEDPERLRLLAEAADLEQVWAVDVELAWMDAQAASDVLQAAEPDTTVIASVHNFNETPDLDEAKRLVQAACRAGDIGKVAFQAQTHRDAVRLLQLTDWARREDLRAATIAMGEIGRHTRVVAPLYGSQLAYAPVESSAATAPGQYDLSTLASLLDLL